MIFLMHQSPGGVMRNLPSNRKTKEPMGIMTVLLKFKWVDTGLYLLYFRRLAYFSYLCRHFILIYGFCSGYFSFIRQF
jgi:hypothetical protein